MSDRENQSNPWIFSKSENKINSLNEEDNKACSLPDTYEIKRCFSLSDDVSNNVDFIASDDFESLWLDIEPYTFEESSPSFSQISENNENFSSMNTSNENTESNLATDSRFISLEAENFLSYCLSSCSLSGTPYHSIKQSTLPSFSESEGVAGSSNEDYRQAPDVMENEYGKCDSIESNVENYDSGESHAEIYDSVEECRVYAPHGFPGTSVSEMNRTNNPECLNEFYSKQIKIPDYGETFISTLVERKEIQSSNYIAGSSNEDNRRATDVMENEYGKYDFVESGMENYDFVNGCRVDDPHGFFGSSFSQLKSTNNPECLNKFQSNPRTERYSEVCTDTRRLISNVCGKGYKKKSHLLTHIFTHEIVKPFKCDMCGKMFIKKSNLQKHIRVHTGEKPFICGICGKSFTQKCNLQSHLLIHTGEKPFVCDICGKSFNQKRYLKKHIRVHKECQSICK